jgi:ribose 1,5-bisphosphokinase
MGAPGTGKAALLAEARRQLQDESTIVFAPRYVTRPRTSRDNPGDVLIGRHQFVTRYWAREFALHWEHSGAFYGLGKEIDGWLREGQRVVVNGSRHYLSRARADYPGLRPVLIDAPAPVVRMELRRQGLSGELLEQRLEREEYYTGLAALGMVRVVNRGVLAEAAARLVDVLLHSVTPLAGPLPGPGLPRQYARSG